MIQYSNQIVVISCVEIAFSFFVTQTYLVCVQDWIGSGILLQKRPRNSWNRWAHRENSVLNSTFNISGKSCCLLINIRVDRFQTNIDIRLINQISGEVYAFYFGPQRIDLLWVADFLQFINEALQNRATEAIVVDDFFANLTDDPCACWTWLQLRPLPFTSASVRCQKQNGHTEAIVCEFSNVTAQQWLNKNHLWTHPVRRRALSRASFALLLRQQITRSANRGNPTIQETMGNTITSGATENRRQILCTSSWQHWR